MNKALTKRGFTLVELILVIGMIAIIGVATVGMLHDSHAIWRMTSKRSTLLQDSQAAMEQMLRMLRQAKRIDTVSAPTDQAGYITFTNTSDIVEEFSRDSGADELDYGEPGSLNALCGTLTGLVLTCYDVDGAALADPVEVSDVRSVEIAATFTDVDDSSINFTLSGRIFCSTDPITLVARWALNETSGLTADDIAANYDGTLTGMNGNEWTLGLLGGALEYDGTNDYLDTPYVGVNGSSARTVTFWIKTTDTSDHGIVAWGDDTTSGANWHIRLNPTSEAGTEGAIRTETQGGYIVGSMNLADGEWHHIASVFDNDGTPNIDDVLHYVDGVADSSSASIPQSIDTDTSGAGAESVSVARRKSSGSFIYLNGMLDDVRIYNTALTAEEVAVLADVLRYREFTEAKTTLNTTSLTISTPMSISEGDLLIAAVATDGNTSSSLAPPGGEGWTEITIGHYSSGVTLGAWWKNAGASESATHQFTWTGAQQAYCWIMRFTGHDPSNPINNWATNGTTSSTPTSAAVTSTVDYALIVRLGAFDGSDITTDSPGLAAHSVITMDGTLMGPGMYWADEQVDKIQRANLDGSNIEDLIATTTMKVKALALDITGGKMYWADEEVDKIRRSGLHSSDIEDLVSAGVMKPRAMALDTAGGKMYWADEEVDKIRRANLDGSNIEDLVSSAVMKPRGLALDIDGGKMYWTGEEIDKIQRANLDGSSIEDLVTGVTRPKALALDIAGGKMYWADEEADKIRRSNLDGSNIEDLVIEAVMKPRALALDVAGGKMYWADEEVDKIRRSNLDGSNIEDLISAAVMKPRALALTLTNVGDDEPISGGAGYVSRALSGSSGTSTFSLTASEETQTLTIAIAPDPDGGCY